VDLFAEWYIAQFKGRRAGKEAMQTDSFTYKSVYGQEDVYLLIFGHNQYEKQQEQVITRLL